MSLAWMADPDPLGCDAEELAPGRRWVEQEVARS